jgi:hypothetical protein
VTPLSDILPSIEGAVGDNIMVPALEGIVSDDILE